MNFGEYLKQLRKEKGFSQRALSEKSGISNAEISRIETGERQKPSPDVLKALAPVLEIEYSELMDKAGYINENISPLRESAQSKEHFIHLLTPILLLDGWGVELCRGNSIGDILAKRDNINWYIDFKLLHKRDNTRNFRNQLMAKDFITRIYGRVSIYDKTPISKYTLAVSNEEMFYQFLNYPPKHLNLEISLMLIDFNSKSIITEYNLNKEKQYEETKKNKPLF